MKILIIHTRTLCYFSAGFFLDRIEEALENLGHRIIRYNMDDESETFGSLDEIDAQGVDAVLDINSKLPFVINDSGDFWLDSLKAPFFNYILDHPLYHHPGLNQPLKNYHAIGIDRMHCTYMENSYPHLKSVSLLPVGGSVAINGRPFEKREDSLLFMGTYYPPEMLDDELDILTESFGVEYKKMVFDLLDSWNPYEITLEEELKKYISETKGSVEEYTFTHSFQELMNQIFPVDRIVRNNLRKKIVDEISKEIPLTLIGEGWKNGKESVFYANSVEQNARYKYVLDINPGFMSGIHDRASNALANGALLLTNMNKSAYSGLADKKSAIYYTGTNVSELLQSFFECKPKAEEIAASGQEWCKNNLSWEETARNLEKVIKYSVGPERG